MDLTLTSKLLKYDPSDVQAVRYTVSYAKNNFQGDAVDGYIQEHCKSRAKLEIAEIFLGETSNANTISAKSSAASGKIDKIKEKPSTEGSTSPAMKSIEAKGDAKKVGYKGGLEGTGTNVVQKEETDWIADVVEELGDEFDELTDEDLENVILEALSELDSEELITEALDSFEDLELLTEAPSKHSAFPNVAVQKPQKEKPARDAGAIAKKRLSDKQGSKPAKSDKPSRMARLGNAAKRVGSAVKSGAKSVAKGAVKGAGYATGLAQRAASTTKREFSKGRERGLKGSGAKMAVASSSSGSGSSGSDTPTSNLAKTSSTTTTTTTTGGGGGSGETKPKKKSLLRRAVGAIGRGLKKVVGKTSRAVSKGSDKLARKLGEDSTMENKVQRVRQILAMQETAAHDKRSLDANANSWRERLGWDLEEEKTPEQKKKSDVLKQTKDLTNKGKHKEASALFKKHFPNFGK